MKKIYLLKKWLYKNNLKKEALAICAHNGQSIDPKFASTNIRTEKDNPDSCPVRTMIYGGLPSNGGLNTFREFGVGLSRAFEAAHCILGSLGRHLGSNGDNFEAMIRTQKDHLNEEVKIIKYVLKEYSRPIYRKQMLLIDLDHYYPEDRERIKENTFRQVEDIRNAGAKLALTAQKLGAQFAESLKGERVPAPWANLAGATYLFVNSLAKSAVKSVNNWPNEVGDPFSDSQVIFYFNIMEKYLKELLA